MDSDKWKSRAWTTKVVVVIANSGLKSEGETTLQEVQKSKGLAHLFTIDYAAYRFIRMSSMNPLLVC